MCKNLAKGRHTNAQTTFPPPCAADAGLTSDREAMALVKISSTEAFSSSVVKSSFDMAMACNSHSWLAARELHEQTQWRGQMLLPPPTFLLKLKTMTGCMFRSIISFTILKQSLGAWTGQNRAMKEPVGILLDDRRNVRQRGATCLGATLLALGLVLFGLVLFLGQRRHGTQERILPGQGKK